MSAVRTIQPHRVRYWGGSAWVVLPSTRCSQCRSGINAQMGSAQLSEEFGTLRAPGTSGIVSVAASVLLRGKRVNVQTWDGAAWVDLWSGIVTAETRADNGPKMGSIQWHALGMAYLLAGFKCINGFELDGLAQVTDRVGYLPAFNAMPGGDRSASKYSVGGVDIYVHNRADQVAKWTARNAIEHILQTQTGYYDMATSSWLYGTTWAISDAKSALAYEVPETDVYGMTVADAMQAIMPASRGITWRIDYDSATDVATVVVGTSVKVSVAGGTYTLPDAPDKVSIDYTGINVDGLSIAWSEEQRADIIEVIGARPWTSISVNFKPADASTSAFESGWSVDDETDFDADKPNADKAWSVFVARGAWKGTQRGSTTVGLSNVLAVSGPTDATYGSAGLTGVRSYDSAIDAADGRTLGVERDLPTVVGFETAVVGDRQLPVVLCNNGSAWIDLSSTQSGSEDWQIQLSEFPLRLKLGSNREDQSILKAMIDTAAPEIVATVGVRESIPLRVSWRRPSASWARTDPRIVTAHVPDCELWTTLSGTVTGLDDAGDPVATTTTDTMRDDRPRMRGVLALLRSLHENPIRALSWSVVGATSTNIKPGAVIVEMTTDQGTEAICAVIDTVVWSFDEDTVSTSYSATPQPPQMEFVR